MDYFLICMFIVCMSGISLMTWLSVHFMDMLRSSATDKIRLIKIGLLLLAFVPLLVICCQLMHWRPPVIILASTLASYDSTHTVSAQSGASRIDFPFYLFSAYVIGLLVMLLRIGLSYLSARKLLSTSSHTVMHGYTVYLSDAIRSPLSFGFPRANIYFPCRAVNVWSERDIQIALTHESIHIERRDGWWKLLSLLMHAFLYFTPWSFYLHRRFEIEIEMFCDQQTCIRTSATSSEYGNLLLRFVCFEQENPIFSNLSNSTLTRRLVAMKAKKIARPLLTTTLATVLLLGGSVVTALAGSVIDKKCTYDVTTKIYVDGVLVSSPRIVALEKQKAAIFIENKGGSTSLKMEFTAKDTGDGNNSIAMKFDVKYKDGTEKLHSKPELVLVPGQEGNVSLSSGSGHLYQMGVMIKRV